MTTVLISGGRSYRHRNRVWQVLDAAIDRLSMTKLVHGKCETGADNFAQQWAEAREFPVEGYAADWLDLGQPKARIVTREDGTRYDAAAGGRRNQQMLDVEMPDVAIIFPGRRGTQDMLTRCKIEKGRRQLIGADLRIIEIDR